MLNFQYAIEESLSCESLLILFSAVKFYYIFAILIPLTDVSTEFSNYKCHYSFNQVGSFKDTQSYWKLALLFNEYHS